MWAIVIERPLQISFTTDGDRPYHACSVYSPAREGCLVAVDDVETFPEVTAVSFRKAFPIAIDVVRNQFQRPLRRLVWKIHEYQLISDVSVVRKYNNRLYI